MVSVKKKLLTLDRIHNWGVVVEDLRCALCESDYETIPHLFFGCTCSKGVMVKVAQWLGIEHFPIDHNRWHAWLGF